MVVNLGENLMSNTRNQNFTAEILHSCDNKQTRRQIIGVLKLDQSRGEDRYFYTSKSIYQSLTVGYTEKRINTLIIGSLIFFRMSNPALANYV